MTKTLQYIQVPNSMCLKGELEPFDVYIYATIKRFMNHNTKEAYPSIQTLKKLTHSGQDKILKSINKLNKKYFNILFRDGKRHYNFFRKYRTFELFSNEFLDSPDLTSVEKSYLLVTQQYMYKDVQNLGKLSFTTKELSLLINMPEWTIYKCDRALQKKGYLNIIKTKNKDYTTGLFLNEKIFNLTLLKQQLIWLVSGNTSKIEKNSIQLKKLRKDLNKVQKLLAQKEKQLKLINQSPINTTDTVVQL